MMASQVKVLATKTDNPSSVLRKEGTNSHKLFSGHHIQSYIPHLGGKEEQLELSTKETLDFQTYKKLGNFFIEVVTRT